MGDRVPHSFGDCELDDLWRKDGRVYETIGFITDPAVVIRDVLSGETETHVVHSRNFAEYVHHPKAAR